MWIGELNQFLASYINIVEIKANVSAFSMQLDIKKKPKGVLLLAFK